MPDRTNFSPAFKTTVAMAAFAGHKAFAQLGSEYGVHSADIRCWLRQAKNFVAEGFAGKPGKGRNKEKKQITALQARIGRLTMERDFFSRGLKENMTIPSRRKLVIKNHRQLSVVCQCRLLHVNRSGLYYKKVGESASNLKLMKLIDQVYTIYPFMGYRQMSRYLAKKGHPADDKRVRRLMRLMGLMGVYQ